MAALQGDRGMSETATFGPRLEGVQYAVYDNIQPTPRYYRLIP